MKILVVTNIYPTPTTPTKGTFVRAQVDGLRRRGVDVDVFVVDRTGRGRSAYRVLGAEIRRRVSNSRPDVVHVMYGGVMADVVTRAIRDVPVVITFYGTDLLGMHRGTRLVTRLSAYCNVTASRRAAGRASAIVVQSKELADALPKNLRPGLVAVWPDGVDFEAFVPLDPSACRRELGWDEDRQHILFPSSRARPEKRYELAEAAVRRLASRRPDIDLHVLEGVPPDRVVTWLNAADVVLLTSRHEGSPNVVKEALACNVAVVSVDVGDVRERLAGVAGSVVAEANTADLADKLELALARPGRVASRELAGDVSIERSSSRLAALYADLAGRRERGTDHGV